MGCSGSKDARVTDPRDELVAPVGENNAIHEDHSASAGHAEAYALHLAKIEQAVTVLCSAS
jgi:hypothetical protein